jgi:DNA-binding CsgD family transcriptional regulator
VVRLVAAGYTNAEIGSELGISVSTAKGHCEVIRAKLGCRFRREIPLAYMCRTGIDPYPRPETT